MDVARFQIRVTCSCGKISEFESALSGPEGQAPLPCACGRKFVLRELDASKVASLAVDPLGVTDREIPDGPPDVH